MDTSFEQKVRERAYEIWMSAGMADGMAHDNWVTAEQAVRNETGAPVKAAKTKIAAPKVVKAAKPAAAKAPATAKKAAPKATAKTSKAKH